MRKKKKDSDVSLPKKVKETENCRHGVVGNSTAFMLSPKCCGRFLVEVYAQEWCMVDTNHSSFTHPGTGLTSISLHRGWEILVRPQKRKKGIHNSEHSYPNAVRFTYQAVSAAVLQGCHDRQARYNGVGSNIDREGSAVNSRLFLYSHLLVSMNHSSISFTCVAIPMIMKRRQLRSMNEHLGMLEKIANDQPRRYIP
jgi:hypothetical protein